MISSELNLIIECCKTSLIEDYEFNFLKETEFQNLNWSQIKSLSSYHCVDPICNENFDKVSNKIINQEEKAYFHSLAKSQLVFNLLLNKEFAKLMVIFEMQKMAVIPFKGIYFNNQLYPRLLREGGDLDFLVNKENILDIIEMLISNGFELSLNSRFKEKVSIKEILFFLQKSNNIELALKKQVAGNIMIEFDLHWDLVMFYHNQKNRFDVKELFSEDIDEIERMFWTILTHNGRREAWSKLKYICDFFAFLLKFESKLDWSNIYKKAVKWGLQNTFKNGVMLCQYFFGISFEKVNIDTSTSLKDMQKYVDYWEIGERWENSLKMRYKFEKLLLMQAPPQFSKIKYLMDIIKYQSFPKPKTESRLVVFSNNNSFLNFWSKIISYLIGSIKLRSK